MTVFGDRVFRNKLRLSEIKRVGPLSNRIDGLIGKGRARSLSLSLSLSLAPHVCTEEKPHEDTVEGGYLQTRKRALTRA